MLSGSLAQGRSRVPHRLLILTSRRPAWKFRRTQPGNRLGGNALWPRTRVVANLALLEEYISQVLHRRDARSKLRPIRRSVRGYAPPKMISEMRARSCVLPRTNQSATSSLKAHQGEMRVLRHDLYIFANLLRSTSIDRDSDESPEEKKSCLEQQA